MSRSDPAAKCSLVLLVTVDSELRLMADKTLHEAGLSLETAEDGQQVLEAFEQTRPDIVLLDVDLPDTDGLAVCNKLRSLHPSDLTPILIIVKPEDSHSLSRVSRVGATDFITKPVCELILRERVQCVLGAGRSHGALAQREARYSTFLDALPDLMLLMGRDGQILDLKPARESLCLPGEARPQGRNIGDILPGEIAERFTRRINEVLDSKQTQVLEYSLLDDELVRDFEARVVVSETDRAMAIVRDVSDRKLAERQTRFLTYHDALTGLRNRASFIDYLRESISRVKLDKSLIAVMFLDLDNFKRFNDQLGHSVGDLLLRKIAARLSSCIRASDVIARHTGEEPEATMGRFGGDEFTILVSKVRRAEEAAIVARRLLRALASSFRFGPHEISVTASIGISIFPLDGDTPEKLLKNADKAMHTAKSFERHSYHFYNAGSLERLSLENDLQKAVKQREFQLYFQPKVDTRSGSVTGTEALLRWHHPRKGVILPRDFIQLAEETGLIFPISDWVLRSACLQRLSWQDAGISSSPVAVNVSGQQFAHSDLVETVSQVLSETKLEPVCLELEITENTVMENVENAITMLRELKKLGVRISVDDFGTGYSSLSYLKRFPLDTIKIDRSFVKDIETDPDSRAIITAIIRMAHSLDLKVVAEGVEEPEQMSFLIGQGCDEVQGFLFCRPIPAEGMAKLLVEAKGRVLPWEWSRTYTPEPATSEVPG